MVGEQMHEVQVQVDWNVMWSSAGVHEKLATVLLVGEEKGKDHLVKNDALNVPNRREEYDYDQVSM